MKKFIQTSQLKTSQKEYQFYSLAEASKKLNRNIENLPYSLKILLENLVRNFDGEIIKEEHLLAVIDSVNNPEKRIEIAFSPARVLMQDFTGVPAVVDLAAMRDSFIAKGADATK